MKKQVSSENPSKQTKYLESIETPMGKKAELLSLKRMAEIYKNKPEIHKYYLTKAKILEDTLKEDTNVIEEVS